MPDNEKSEQDLAEAARKAILKKIPDAVANDVSGQRPLRLAMAYVVLFKGKLPAEPQG